MFDQFLEEIVVRKKGKALFQILYVLAFFFSIVFALFAFVMLQNLFMQFAVGNLISTLLMGVSAFICYRYKDNLRVEYEYAYTSGEMDFAKVLSNVRRKHLLTLNLKNVESGGWVEDDAFGRLMQNKEVKRHYYAINGDSRMYYLYFIKEGQKQVVIFEPSEKMVKLIHDFRPSILAAW